MKLGTHKIRHPNDLHDIVTSSNDVLIRDKDALQRKLDRSLAIHFNAIQNLIKLRQL